VNESLDEEFPVTTTLKPATSLQVQCGADIVVQSLINHGVEVIFAYPGGASMPLHQSLTKFKDKIRTILPRHEQGGAFAAQGYSRSTGKVGVCMATSGPGATNLVTAIADAKMDSIPLIALTGQVKTHVIGTDAFQETPIIEVCRAVTKHHYLVTDIRDLTRVMREAFHVATTGRPGPVLIDLPKDIQQDQIVPDYDVPMQLPGYHVEQRLAKPEQIAQAAAAIKLAKKPMIYAGGGIIASGASQELREFVAKTNIPIAMTVMGLGAYPTDGPLSLRMLGMHGTVYSNYAINESDLLLAFGVRFDDRVTGKFEEFCKHGTIVHVDIDASELNKNRKAHLPVVGDIKDTLARLNAMLAKRPLNKKHTPWLEQVAEWKKKAPFAYAVTPEIANSDHMRDHLKGQEDQVILPQMVIEMLYELTKGDAYITTGVGQHQMWSGQWYKYKFPRQFITSAGLGAMGFGYPAARGVKVAHPDKEVIDIDGDGSFLMNIQELATAHVEKIAAKAIILNNQHLGMVVQWEDNFYAGNRGHTYLGNPDNRAQVYPDYVRVCTSFNVPCERVLYRRELKAALQRMLDAKTPYVLDVVTPYSEHVLPFIPAGRTVADMVWKA